ncbi:MAG: hypothetical protein ACU85V_16600 [Gammaproteobacteria bacterium]
MIPSPPRRALRASLLFALLVTVAGCSSVSVPKVSMPKLPEIGNKEPEDLTTTPRDLLTARLVNPRAREDTPSMTVGKLIEFADRYLSCDCAKTRFVRAWERTPEGYRLLTNSEFVRPIQFVCADTETGRECFLTEIDRGAGRADLSERFVRGSEFIQFLYDNGVRCEREEPCP